jgi:glucose-1-phosphate cytidylyltransferase
MKVIILAGGLGTRISEETSDKPKPMVEIGSQPMIWHIIQIYALQGFRDFVVAGGYKHEVIENWIKTHYKKKSLWIRDLNILVLDTGLSSLTGTRISKCISEFSDSRFLCTYGDGVANININKLVEFHEKSKKIATLTSVRPPARFGHVTIKDDRVTSFDEKNQADEGWINGGFFVFEREIVNYISIEDETFEKGALPRLASGNNLMAFKHHGFWQSMDTLRDKESLTKMINSSSLEKIPWLTLK